MENKAIIRIPEFNDESCEQIPSQEPQLDPYSSQFYIENYHLDETKEIKIYNSDLIKYVDTNYLYSTEEVYELEIGEIKEKNSIFQIYKKFYLNIFNTLGTFFNKKKLINIAEPAKNEIN